MNQNNQKRWSQFGVEDDITLDLVARLAPPQFFVEIGAGGHGTPGENNTHCLLDAGWNGLWVDAKPDGLKQYWRPGLTIVEKHVTLDNLCELLSTVPKEFGVFSLDIDGNDWWIWRQLFVLGWRPWLCIVEFNAQRPLDKRYIAPYRPAYAWDHAEQTIGASLFSMTEMAVEYGYVLHRTASDTPHLDSPNAFFVRDDLTKRLS